MHAYCWKSGILQKRASGEISTMAHWMREFVRSHQGRHSRKRWCLPMHLCFLAYKKDSVVSDEIAYDMLVKMNKIQLGQEHCPSLHGNFR